MKRCNTNSQRLIKYAIMSTEQKKRDEYINSYKKSFNISMLVGGTIMLFLSFFNVLIFISDSTSLGIFYSFLVLIIGFFMIYPIICFKKILKKIERDNIQLMYFEGEVLKKYKQFELRSHHKSGNQYYIVLCDGIVIQVTKEEYFKLTDTLNKLRIYFFEDLLKEQDLFNIEFIN